MVFNWVCFRERYLFLNIIDTITDQHLKNLSPSQIMFTPTEKGLGTCEIWYENRRFWSVGVKLKALKARCNSPTVFSEF